GVLGIPFARLFGFEVRVLDDELAVVALIVERAAHGMAVVDVEEASGPNEGGGDAGPAPNIGQPAERTDGGVNDVELLVQHLLRVVDVRLYETGVGDADLFSERACLFDGRFGEVEAGDGGAKARPVERVHAEVALEVKQRLAADVSDFGQFGWAERLLAAEEAGHVVGLGGGVDGDGFQQVEFARAVLGERRDARAAVAQRGDRGFTARCGATGWERRYLAAAVVSVHVGGIEGRNGRAAIDVATG